MDSIRKQAEIFWDINQEINSVYEEYARSVGLSYTSLFTLHIIAWTENCTQKYIAEQMFLPKQTIHSVVTAICRQGLVEYREVSEDRRHKTLHLTEKGREYAGRILSRMEDAEVCGIAQFSREERSLFLQMMRRYTNAFSAALR